MINGKRPSDLPGRAMTWLTGGTLALNLLLVAGLLALLIWNGAGYRSFREALLSNEPPTACASCGLRWSL